MSVSRSVPCGACTLCCRGELIILHPEDGDQVATYHTAVMRNLRGDGRDVHVLQRGTDGDSCIYLGPQGCTIYDRRPAICRSFDCRKLFQVTPRPVRRRMIATGSADKAVFDRGRELLSTLPQPPEKGTP